MKNLRSTCRFLYTHFTLHETLHFAILLQVLTIHSLSKGNFRYRQPVRIITSVFNNRLSEYTDSNFSALIFRYISCSQCAGYSYDTFQKCTITKALIKLSRMLDEYFTTKRRVFSLLTRVLTVNRFTSLLYTYLPLACSVNVICIGWILSKFNLSGKWDKIGMRNIYDLSHPAASYAAIGTRRRDIERSCKLETLE